MNDAPPTPSPFVRPLTVIIGFVLGLIVLAWAGRRLTDRDWQPQFTRFHPLISPDSQYQPTIDEMRAIVRARCRPEQTLVIVGGNSILLGVGQPAADVWTLHLQRLLGPTYAVVNLAFRGAMPTDGAAIVAESLRAEFPRQIYVANVRPHESPGVLGSDTYRYLLLEARARGYLLPFASREESLQQRLETTANRDQIFDTRVSTFLDNHLRFRSVWNWVMMTRVSLYPNSMLPNYPETFWARNRFKDQETDFDDIPTAQRFSAATVAADLNIATRYTELFYEKDTTGAWIRVPSAAADFKRSAETGFPPEMRSRTLLLISGTSPFYTKRLPPDIQARDTLAVRDSIADLMSSGYAALSYGETFAEGDYGDRSHLTKRGGVKLAALVATKIKEMSPRVTGLTLSK